MHNNKLTIPSTTTSWVTVTSTPTVTSFVTDLRTLDATATTTISVVDTDRREFTETKFDDRTLTLTTTDATVTVTIANEKRQATVKPTNIPTYASACSGSVRYSSACSCVGATAATVTAAQPTVTETSTETKVLDPVTVLSTTATATLTTIVTTVPVTTTWSTATVSEAIATEEVTRTTTTQTVAATATAIVKSRPQYKLQFVYADPANTKTFVTLTISGNVVFIDATADASKQASFELNSQTGVLRGAPGNGNGWQSWRSKNTIATNTLVLLLSDEYGPNSGGMPANCRVTAEQKLRCIYRDNLDADWYLCNGHLNMVAPGANLNCGTTAKVDIVATAL